MNDPYIRQNLMAENHVFCVGSKGSGKSYSSFNSMLKFFIGHDQYKNLDKSEISKYLSEFTKRAILDDIIHLENAMSGE